VCLVMLLSSSEQPSVCSRLRVRGVVQLCVRTTTSASCVRHWCVVARHATVWSPRPRFHLVWFFCFVGFVCFHSQSERECAVAARVCENVWLLLRLGSCQSLFGFLKNLKKRAHSVGHLLVIWLAMLTVVVALWVVCSPADGSTTSAQ
jgi:hypothetical protein